MGLVWQSKFFVVRKTSNVLVEVLTASARAGNFKKSCIDSDLDFYKTEYGSALTPSEYPQQVDENPPLNAKTVP